MSMIDDNIDEPLPKKIIDCVTAR